MVIAPERLGSRIAWWRVVVGATMWLVAVVTLSVHGPRVVVAILTGGAAFFLFSCWRVKIGGLEVSPAHPEVAPYAREVCGLGPWPLVLPLVVAGVVLLV